MTYTQHAVGVVCEKEQAAGQVCGSVPPVICRGKCWFDAADPESAHCSSCCRRPRFLVGAGTVRLGSELVGSELLKRGGSSAIGNSGFVSGSTAGHVKK